MGDVLGTARSWSDRLAKRDKMALEIRPQVQAAAGGIVGARLRCSDRVVEVIYLDGEIQDLDLDH